MAHTLKAIIENELNRIDSEILKCKEKMDTHYLYNFEWGYPAELYTLLTKKNHLTELLDFINTQPERASEWLKYNISKITGNILGGSFVGSSTNHFSNMAHTLKKEVLCEMLKKYQGYLEILKDTPVTEATVTQ